MFNNINTRSVTFNLIAINVVLFIATLAFPQLDQLLGLHYIFNTHHYAEGSNFQPYQIITHMFMHGGFMHILFNMYGLFMFGNILEQVWGPKKFLTYYMITGFGSVVLDMVVKLIIVHNFTGSFDPSLSQLENFPQVYGTYLSNTIGASGAIYGVLVAFAMLFPNTDLYLMFVPVPVKAKYLIGFFILFELYLGFRMSNDDNVAHFAHLGGALFGFILVKIWNRNRTNFY